MKKSVLYIFLLLFVISCDGLHNKYEKNLEAMGITIKQAIEDNIFKENGTIEFLEFKPIKYDTVPFSAYDDCLKGAYLEELKRHHDRIELYSLKIERELGSYELSKLAQSQTGMELSRREIDKLGDLQNDELKISDEIFNKINEIDSLSHFKDSTEVFYQMKIFVKAVVTDNSEGTKTNLLDTLYYLFDTDLNLMKLPDVTVEFAQ